MATKKTSTPAARYLRYELTNSATPGTETSHYIDLAKDLSAINRRLYRQGRCYHVKRISIVSSNTIPSPGQNAGRVTFGVVPDTWVARGAWKRGFDAWRKMQRKAVQLTGNDITPTWNDFKVYLTNDHKFGTALSPLDNGGNVATAGDWSYSVFRSPDGTTSADDYNAHMLGAHNGSVGAYNNIGLIQSYGDARATIAQPSPNVQNTADDDPLANLFDDGTVTDEVIADMRSKGEDAPYAIGGYPGDGTNHPKPLVVQQTTLGADGRATVGGFSAMCGLVEIEATSPIGSDVYSVLVELAPGSYRGIAAEVI